MSDALLVLNAGSSSLKFSVFLNQDPPEPIVRGQIEGLTSQPRFVARNDSAVISQKEWPPETQLGHSGAIEFLFAWGRAGALSGQRIIAVGHRVVHGGTKFHTPVVVSPETLAELETLKPLAPLHQPHNKLKREVFTKLANLRTARPSAIAEDSIYQLFTAGIFIA